MRRARAPLVQVGGVWQRSDPNAEGTERGQPGLTRAEMAAYGFELPADITEHGWFAVGENAARGKETRDEGRARAARVAARLRSMSADISSETTIALVSHGDFLGLLLTELLGVPSSVRFKHFNTAMSCVELRQMDEPASNATAVAPSSATGVSVKVLYINSVSHLEPNQFRSDMLGVV